MLQAALHLAGYTEYDACLMQGDPNQRQLRDHIAMTAGHFKSECRVLLVDMGYEIVATIGDQASDFYGELTGFEVKVPNLLYTSE